MPFQHPKAPIFTPSSNDLTEMISSAEKRFDHQREEEKATRRVEASMLAESNQRRRRFWSTK